MKIGITERGDAGLDLSWMKKVQNKEVDGAIAITKAPHKLLKYNLPSNVVIHCTITGLGGMKLEPNVVRPDIAMDAAIELLNRYGPERVVLRIDPILWRTFSSYALNIYETGRRFGFQRILISFIDLYPHVIERFKKANISTPNTNPFHLPLDYRMEIYKEMGKSEICAEPGFSCTGCVSARDIVAMGFIPQSFKRKGQRPLCNCIAAKTELLNNKSQCSHKCLYCYWR